MRFAPVAVLCLLALAVGLAAGYTLGRGAGREAPARAADLAAENAELRTALARAREACAAARAADREPAAPAGGADTGVGGPGEAAIAAEPARTLDSARREALAAAKSPRPRRLHRRLWFRLTAAAVLLLIAAGVGARTFLRKEPPRDELTVHWFSHANGQDLNRESVLATPFARRSEQRALKVLSLFPVVVTEDGIAYDVFEDAKERTIPSIRWRTNRRAPSSRGRCLRGKCAWHLRELAVR
jgi:hypothetical protein